MSEFTETSSPSQFNKDAMTTSVSKTPLSSSKEKPVKTDHVYTSACDNNHNPHLEERLKPPDDTNSLGIVCSNSNSPIPKNHTPTVNGSVDRNICCQLDDGVAVSCLDNKNQEQSESPPNHSSVNKYDSEIKVTAASASSNSNVSMSASDVSSMMSPQSESSLVLDCDCDDTEQCEESRALNSDKCNGVDVEKLIDGLEKTSMQDISAPEEQDIVDGITYVVYESEKQMPDIMRLITKDLSEPYSIYTYRYFIHNWPKLCFLAMDGDICIGAIVCKLDLHKKMVRRGYIAMLAVDSAYRRRKLGSTLVTKAIKAMIRDDCDEVVLETEITNQAALRLYENLGFVRDKRLFRYYLNGVDALRLKLWLR